MRALLAAVILALAAVPAVADPVPSTTVVAPAPNGSADQVICKEMPAPSGSRIPAGKECHTRLEWESMQVHGVDAAKMYDHSDRPASFQPPSGGGMGH